MFFVISFFVINFTKIQKTESIHKLHETMYGEYVSQRENMKKKLLLIVFSILFVVGLRAENSQERVVNLTGDIDDNLTEAVTTRLMELDSESHKPISLVINSTGGDVYCMFMIYDTMQFVESPVITICGEMAASGAAVLLGAGEKGMRYAHPKSRILLHAPYFQDVTSEENIQRVEEEIEKLKKEFIIILAENTGKSEDELMKDLKGEIWLTPEEAIAYGLIDAIIE